MAYPELRDKETEDHLALAGNPEVAVDQLPPELLEYEITPFVPSDPAATTRDPFWFVDTRLQIWLGSPDP